MLLSSLVPAVALACFALAVPVDEAVTPVIDVSENKSFLVQAPQSFNLSKRQDSSSGNSNNGGTRYCDRRGRCCGRFRCRRCKACRPCRYGRCSFAQDFDVTEFEGLDEPEDKVTHKDKAAVVVNSVDSNKVPTPAIKNVDVVEKDAAPKDSKVDSEDSHVVADDSTQDLVKRQGYGGGGGCGACNPSGCPCGGRGQGCGQGCQGRPGCTRCPCQPSSTATA